MTEQEFQRNMSGAESFKNLADNPNDSSYWEGYVRGIRRNYHGESFGTTNEHALWLSLAEETGDDQRRFRGIGYQAGIDGKPISEAIEYLETVKTA